MQQFELKYKAKLEKREEMFKIHKRKAYLVI